MNLPTQIELRSVRALLPRARNSYLVALGVLVSSCWASAQTKISGSLECARPSFRKVMEVGDRAPHTMVLSQRLCEWSRPLRMEGVSSRDDVLSLFTDARADGVRDHGYNIMVMSNGDKIFMHYAGSLKNDGRSALSGEGNFALSGGTGKFLGIYGSGTLTSRSTADGKMTVRIEGQYTLPKF